MGVFDVHSHLIVQEYLDRISEDGNILGERLEHGPAEPTIVMANGMRYTLVESLHQPDAVLAEMNAAGIDRALISPPPTVFHYELDVDAARDHARRLNDALAEVVENNKQRLSGAAYVPLQDTESAVLELERCVSSLGMRAVHICSHVMGHNLDDERFEDFFRSAETHGVLVLVHPWNVAGGERLRNYHLGNSVGNPMETAIAAASLLFGGVMERFPDLRVCLSHAGGALPYIVGRLDRAYDIRPEARAKIRERPSRLISRFYFDTIAHSPVALDYLVKLVGWRQVLLGSDFPFHLQDMGDPAPVASVHAVEGLGPDAVEGILGANLAGLLRTGDGTGAE